jgi:hypothetical protein
MMNFIEARKIASSNMQEGIVADAMGNKQEAIRFFEIAFEAEKQAALSLLTNFEQEPFRSVLFRSAASLAMNCKKYEEAKTMIHFGLAGNPPKGIVVELMEVYETVEREIRLAALSAPKNRKSANYFWLRGILTVADARQHQIRIVSDDNKIAKVHFPKDLGEIVRNYWNEYVNAYILKQGKILTLVEIDKIFMQKTA